MLRLIWQFPGLGYELPGPGDGHRVLYDETAAYCLTCKSWIDLEYVR